MQHALNDPHIIDLNLNLTISSCRNCSNLTQLTHCNIRSEREGEGISEVGAGTPNIIHLLPVCVYDMVLSPSLYLSL